MHFRGTKSTGKNHLLRLKGHPAELHRQNLEPAFGGRGIPEYKSEALDSSQCLRRRVIRAGKGNQPSLPLRFSAAKATTQRRGRGNLIPHFSCMLVREGYE